MKENFIIILKNECYFTNKKILLLFFLLYHKLYLILSKKSLRVSGD